MPFEPDVRPWSGVSAVSPSIMVMRATGTSSSSATIWRNAMRKPWPRSTLPLNMVIEPSALTARKASTSFGSSTRGAARCAAAERNAFGPTNAKPTVSAPVLSTVRRETWRWNWAFMSASLRDAHDGGEHAHLRPAAAQIAFQCGADLAFARLLVLCQQSRRAHDHAVGAIAALRHLLVDECLLQRMR